MGWESVITFNICHGNMLSDNRKNNLKIIHRREYLGEDPMATIKNVYIATYTLFQWANNSLIARKYDREKFILKTHFVTQVK